jgi:hypothetical protein
VSRKAEAEEAQAGG